MVMEFFPIICMESGYSLRWEGVDTPIGEDQILPVAQSATGQDFQPITKAGFGARTKSNQQVQYDWMHD
jgi:hypothetical protein